MNLHMGTTKLGFGRRHATILSFVANTAAHEPTAVCDWIISFTVFRTVSWPHLSPEGLCCNITIATLLQIPGLCLGLFPFGHRMVLFLNDWVRHEKLLAIDIINGLIFMPRVFEPQWPECYHDEAIVITRITTTITASCWYSRRIYDQAKHIDLFCPSIHICCSQLSLGASPAPLMAGHQCNTWHEAIMGDRDVFCKEWQRQGTLYNIKISLLVLKLPLWIYDNLLNV